MEDETTAAAMLHVPHELVTQILLRLPIESLMRFTCHEHLRLQKPGVLIAPQTRINNRRDLYKDTPVKVTTPGLYRWEMSQGAATLILATDPFPAEQASIHRFAHCDGLVLMVMSSTVRVLNPATCRILPLPQSPHDVLTPLGCAGSPKAYCLTLGYDPRTNAYKVTRFYHRSAELVAGTRSYAYGMEVFTIGRDMQWRETAEPPPYPVMPGQPATFFKGFLLWTIDERRGVPVRGFLRFSLEDESFSVVPAPPGCPYLHCSTSSLAEMLGELWLAHGVHPIREGARIWACDKVDGTDPPLWVWRDLMNIPRYIHLLAMFDDGLVFREDSRRLVCSHSQSTLDDRHQAMMDDLRYHHPDASTLVKYTQENVHVYVVIPYIPSLVPINIRCISFSKSQLLSMFDQLYSKIYKDI
ncbi:hypothetical protein VPH35_026678 [Triticum aestivum]